MSSQMKGTQSKVKKGPACSSFGPRGMGTYNSVGKWMHLPAWKLIKSCYTCVFLELNLQCPLLPRAWWMGLKAAILQSFSLSGDCPIPSLFRDPSLSCFIK